MHTKKVGLATVLALVLALPASAGAKTLIGSGSSVAQPYMQALFAGYHKVNPRVQFLYTANGGNAGVKDVQSGRSQFAVNTRPPLPSDAGTTYVKLFLDGLCVYVNSSNKLANLSIGELSDVFTGVRTSWSQIPGSGLSTTIDAVGRDSTAGSFTFFTAAILNGQTQGSNVTTQASDGLVANAIKQDPNAIGYDGLAWQGHGQKTLRVNGVPCKASKISVEPLKYPLSRYLFLVLPNSGVSPALQKFIDWARRSPEAGPTILAAGGVPAFNKKPKK